MLLVYDQIYGDHLRGVPHPESPDRVQVVAAFLAHSNAFLPARDASNEEIELVHGAAYVDLVRRESAGMRGHAGYLSTGDTLVDARSNAVARRAAGGAIVAAETAMEHGEPVFAIVRPPGHHAESTRGMGFCLFNNAMIAARAMQASHGVRALIVDFDYHHGNGTQASSGNGVSYVSTHGYPAYPGTGGPDENYLLPGNDVIVNVPLPPHGFGTEAFIATWEALLPSLAARVRPDILIVSAGFDYVAGDPVGDLGVAPHAAAHLAALINEVARTHCSGRVAYVLEGGYNVAALTESIDFVVKAHDKNEARKNEAAAGAVPPAQKALLSKIGGLFAR